MVGLGRVELPTRSLGNCCSIHLSYSPDSLELDSTTVILTNEVDRSIRWYPSLDKLVDLTIQYGAVGAVLA